MLRRFDIAQDHFKDFVVLDGRKKTLFIHAINWFQKVKVLS